MRSPKNANALQRSLAVLSCGTALQACAPQPIDAPPASPSMEQRVSDLEQRIERLEARPDIQPAFRSKAELESEVKSLQEARTKLLTRYTDQHPEIRDIDRRLTILDRQLKLLEQSP